jgi:hypothetical protein
MSAPVLPVSSADAETALGCAGPGEEVALVGGDILDVPAMSSILPLRGLIYYTFSSTSNNVTLVGAWFRLWRFPFPLPFSFLFKIVGRRGSVVNDGGKMGGLE